jgi:hypothetical protein
MWTDTSRGYINAHEVTPASEPQTKGIKDVGIGNHAGVGPCSPERWRPNRCRIASYSKKYKAVPAVSRTMMEPVKQSNKQRNTLLAKVETEPYPEPG